MTDAPKPTLTEAEREDGLARAIWTTGACNLPLRDPLDVDCHDAARAVIASGWVSPEEAKAREAAARREALLQYDRAVAMAREANAAAIEHWNRADKAEAKVARVEALAEEWDGLVNGRSVQAAELRAALAEPERDEEGR